MNVDVDKIVSALIVAGVTGLTISAFNLHKDVARLKLENELSNKTCLISCDQLEVHKLKLLQIIDKQHYKKDIKDR